MHLSSHWETSREPTLQKAKSGKALEFAVNKTNQGEKMNLKHTKAATGIAQVAFATPKHPVDVGILTLLPYEALVTKIKVEYITVPRAEADAAWSQSIEATKANIKKRKRHLAAVKANATRKARKAEGEAANG
ncbi:MAG: hypothetical protein IIZ06_02115 [Kiritimatiellae bacterium]|nr:hypothetical protein [Kiritimatiellia bacterium]